MDTAGSRRSVGDPGGFSSGRSAPVGRSPFDAAGKRLGVRLRVGCQPRTARSAPFSGSLRRGHERGNGRRTHEPRRARRADGPSVRRRSRALHAGRLLWPPLRPANIRHGRRSLRESRGARARCHRARTDRRARARRAHRAAFRAGNLRRSPLWPSPRLSPRRPRAARCGPLRADCLFPSRRRHRPRDTGRRVDSGDPSTLAWPHSQA